MQRKSQERYAHRLPKKRGRIFLAEARTGEVRATATLTEDQIATESILQLQCCQDELKTNVMRNPHWWTLEEVTALDTTSSLSATCFLGILYFFGKIINVPSLNECFHTHGVQEFQNFF